MWFNKHTFCQLHKTDTAHSNKYPPLSRQPAQRLPSASFPSFLLFSQFLLRQETALKQLWLRVQDFCQRSSEYVKELEDF